MCLFTVVTFPHSEIDLHGATNAFGSDFSETSKMFFLLTFLLLESFHIRLNRQFCFFNLLCPNWKLFENLIHFLKHDSPNINIWTIIFATNVCEVDFSQFYECFFFQASHLILFLEGRIDRFLFVNNSFNWRSFSTFSFKFVGKMVLK